MVRGGKYFFRPLPVSLLILLLAIVAILTLIAKPGSSSAEESRPNVVLIVSDDQRMETLSVMPNVQSLISSGTNFSKAYASTALCCPSRSTILSGQYAHNHNVTINEVPFNTFQDSSTLATWLHDSGYKTGLFGKYLNSYRSQVNKKTGAYYVPPGWDTFQAFQKPAYFDYVMTNYVNGVKHPLQSYVGNIPSTNYSTDVIAGKAVDFMNQAESNDEQPFFAYVAPFATHKPYIPAPRHGRANPNIGTYNPPSLNEADVSDKPAWVRNTPPMDSATLAKVPKNRLQQHRMSLSLDELVGQIKTKLTDLGELDNTVIIYMGDNGFHLGEHRLYEGKDTPYEEAAKIPIVIYDGRNPQARTISNLVANVDIAPTILSLSGLLTPDSVDGRSLISFLEDQVTPWRTELMQESWGGSLVGDAGPFGALRDGTWKLVDYATGEKELYDLSADPYELENLASRPEHAVRIATMKAKLDQLRTCEGQTCN